jgi:L-2-hydroxyglutarate oxidase
MTLNSQPAPDVVVIGAGAIGACSALALTRQGMRVLVLEKEDAPARHQSSRNSGVIHAGYNLTPGSLKAKYCVEGNRRLRAFCLEHGIPMRQGGILIVARTQSQREVIAELKRRADANGVDSRVVDVAEIAEIEPYARGVMALHAPEGASFDSEGFVRRVVAEAEAAGGRVQYGVAVQSVAENAGSITIETSAGTVSTGVVVNCAGLHADRVAGSLANDLRLVPFRGYYAELTPDAQRLVRSHVYAAPDLEFPFLGVHVSRQADGRVLVGPGAMLAFGREAYAFHHIVPRDLAGTLAWPGFYRLFKQPKFRGLIRSELAKSLSLRAIWSEARELIPELQRGQLTRSFAGNRAQLVTRDGELVTDILVRETEHAVHVLNAVSPGLTCSLPFGEDVARRVLAKLE